MVSGSDSRHAHIFFILHFAFAFHGPHLLSRAIKNPFAVDKKGLGVSIPILSSKASCLAGISTSIRLRRTGCCGIIGPVPPPLSISFY